MGTKPIKMHIHNVNPHATQDDEGQRVVETLCEQYYAAARVVSVADYRDWTMDKCYTVDIFCGHCRASLQG